MEGPLRACACVARLASCRMSECAGRVIALASSLLCSLLLLTHVLQAAAPFRRQRLAGGVLATLAAADELAAALQRLEDAAGGGSNSSSGGTGGGSAGAAASEAAAAAEGVAGDMAAAAAADNAGSAAAGTAEAGLPAYQPWEDEPLAPALALPAARSWALAAWPAVLQLPQGQEAAGALAAALSSLPVGAGVGSRQRRQAWFKACTVAPCTVSPGSSEVYLPQAHLPQLPAPTPAVLNLRRRTAARRRCCWPPACKACWRRAGMRRMGPGASGMATVQFNRTVQPYSSKRQPWSVACGLTDVQLARLCSWLGHVCLQARLSQAIAAAPPLRCRSASALLLALSSAANPVLCALPPRALPHPAACGARSAAIGRLRASFKQSSAAWAISARCAPVLLRGASLVSYALCFYPTLPRLLACSTCMLGARLLRSRMHV